MTAPLDRTAWAALVDDTGDNLSGTPWTKDKIKTVLLDPIDAALALFGPLTIAAISPTALVAATHNLVIGNAVLINLQATGAQDLTGLDGGVLNRIAILSNVGASTITIKNEHAGSLAANRFYMPVGGDQSLPADTTQVYVRQAASGGGVGRWRRLIGG